MNGRFRVIIVYTEEQSNIAEVINVVILGYKAVMDLIQSYNPALISQITITYIGK